MSFNNYYDKHFDKYEMEDEPKSKRPSKESECGEIKVKAENVYITINCKEKKDY